MAKQKGPVYITGTKDGITYYEMNGKHYARRKSSLSRKRVKNDPAFELTRAYAGLMAAASQLAAAVYRRLPKDKKKHALYRTLTGQALQLLKRGMDKELILEKLQPVKVKAVQQQPAVVMRGCVIRTIKGGKAEIPVRYRVAENGGLEEVSAERDVRLRVVWRSWSANLYSFLIT